MKISSNLDAASLAAAYGAAGRMHIPSFLDTASAIALHDELAAEQSWHFSIFVDGRSIEMESGDWRKLDAASKHRTQEIVHDGANRDFAYMHYKLPIYDRYHAGGNLGPRARSFFEFINGAPFLAFARRLTGCADIAFADAQASAFGPGHFITIHNDDIDGKSRRAAYVLNLTPEWREDWGGYLNFFDEFGHISAGFKPAFNALNVFSIPAAHSVSTVALFAKKPRLAISGWLRAGVDPKRR